MRLFAEPLGLAPALPQSARLAYPAFSVTPRSVQEWVDEGVAMSASAAQARSVRSFGALPLIVLTRGLDLTPDWQRMQRELLRLSSNSHHVIAHGSGHNVETELPEAATGAILKMVKRLR